MWETFTNPIVQGVLWSVIGLAVKAFCPAFIPWLGAAKKAQDELIELHHEAAENDQSIYERALEKGKIQALKALEKHSDFKNE